MINIDKCKNVAKSLAKQSSEKLGEQKLNEFLNTFSKFATEYRDQYMLYSTAIKLEKLESFNKWIPKIMQDKDLLTPLVVDKMVNEKDLYFLSLYQNFYTGTDLMPNIDEYKSQYYENGGGENALALITGCYWVEQIESSELVE